MAMQKSRTEKSKKSGYEKTRKEVRARRPLFLSDTHAKSAVRHAEHARRFTLTMLTWRTHAQDVYADMPMKTDVPKI
jgi:hypothetical protein